MTITTLVTEAQLAIARLRANAIASSTSVVASAATFKFLFLLDGTRNIASNPGYSDDLQPTSIGQLKATLDAQGVQTNAKYPPKE